MRIVSFLLLVIFVATPALGGETESEFRTRFGVGAAIPASGKLRDRWNSGPSLGLHQRVLGDSRWGLHTNAVYRYFPSDHGNGFERGFGTHGFGVTLSTEWSPRFLGRLILEGNSGFAGLRTSNPVVPQVDIATSDLGCGCYSRTTIGKIRGGGPTLGAGLGFLVAQNDDGAIWMRGIYQRTWASDGFLDVFTFSILWSLSKNPRAKGS